VIPLRDALPARRRAVVTKGLVLACFAVFGYELWVAGTSGDAALEALFDRYGVVPADLTAGLAAGDVAVAVTLVTHLFLHAGWLHLAGNMLYLWIFGNNVEDRLGRLGYLLAYLAFGAIAALGQVWTDPTSTVPLIGASGAISGILGVYLVLYPRARVMSLVFLVFFYQLMEVPAVVLIGLWFVLQLLAGIATLGAGADAAGGVAVFAHLGGFLAGVLLGLAIRAAGRGDRPPLRLSVG
jgi:membrane associated rhomboid family serine protease